MPTWYDSALCPLLLCSLPVNVEHMGFPQRLPAPSPTLPISPKNIMFLEKQRRLFLDSRTPNHVGYVYKPGPRLTTLQNESRSNCPIGRSLFFLWRCIHQLPSISVSPNASLISWIIYNWIGQVS